MQEQNKSNLIPYFESRKFLITISCFGRKYKIIKIIFNKSDGSIFITFPYFKHSRGIISLTTFPGDMEEPADLSLIPGGKVVSHLVKYSHHPNGKVLFSQDGKILSEIKKISAPLDTNPGHIFTIQLQGIKGFAKLEKNQKEDSQTEKQRALNFNFRSLPETVKLTAMWNTKNHIAKNCSPPFTNPVIAVNKRGDEKPSFLISPIKNTPTYHSAMILSAESIPKLTNESGSHLTFAGGFDTKEIIYKNNGDIRFLSLIYPADNFEKLKKEIGSIDFNLIKSPK